MACAPLWYTQGHTCPYGEDFLYLTTWPRLGTSSQLQTRLSIYINVFYSLLPALFFMCSVLFIFYALLFSGAHNLSSATRHAKLGDYKAWLKYIILSMLVMALVEMEKVVFSDDRPSTSCMHSCGTPDGMDTWSAALFMARCIDLMFRWSVPHLTTPLSGLETNDKAGLPPYTVEEARQLGYSPIETGELLTRLLLLYVFLGPVPVARILLGDAEYLQVVFGVMQGVAFAVCFHVSYVRLLTSEEYGATLHRLLEYSMLSGGLFREGLQRRLRAGGEAAERLQRLPQDFSEAFAEAKAAARGLTEGDLAEDLILRKTSTSKRSVYFPGMEFLGIRTDRTINLMQLQTEEKVAEIKRVELQCKAVQDELEEKQQAFAEMERRLATAQSELEEKQQAFKDMERALSDREEQLAKLNEETALQKEELARIQKERDEDLAKTRKAMEVTLNWAWPESDEVRGTLVPVSDKALLQQLQDMLDNRIKTEDNWTRDRGCTLHGRGNSECSLQCANQHRVPVPRGFRVVRAFRNQNMDLWEAYTMTRNKILQECKQYPTGQFEDVATMNNVTLDAQFLKPGCNEWRLLHGTRLEACRSICRKNFLLTFVGKGATWPGQGPLYGRGIYLAEKITKADEYAEPAPSGDEFEGLFAVLVVRCVGGRVNVSRTNAVDKEKLQEAIFHGDYNSVFGERTKITPHPKPYNEFVVYDQNQLYPEFLLLYERKWE